MIFGGHVSFSTRPEFQLNLGQEGEIRPLSPEDYRTLVA